MTDPCAERRIVFAIGSLSLGGAETQLAMLAEGLNKRGWSVKVLILESGGELAHRLERAGISVIDAGYQPREGGRLHKALALATSEIRLIWQVLRYRPHVVQGFLPLTNFMIAIAGRLTFVPLVVTSRRALGTHQDRHPRLKWMDHTANSLSHVITANSRAVARDTVQRDHVENGKMIVIPNGLDVNRFACVPGQRQAMRSELGLSTTDVAIGMIANLIAYKGHAELLQAFASVVAVHPNLRLFLVGEDRGIGEILRAKAQEFGIADVVIFTGSRNDIPAFLSALDIGVMASHEEGFSNALLEKLAAGLPVVATNVGGNPEALADMPGCVLVRPGDAEDLARGMIEAVIDLTSARASHELRQQKVRERYSVDAMVGVHEQLYARLGGVEISDSCDEEAGCDSQGNNGL